MALEFLSGTALEGGGEGKSSHWTDLGAVHLFILPAKRDGQKKASAPSHGLVGSLNWKERNWKIERSEGERSEDRAL